MASEDLKSQEKTNDDNNASIQASLSVQFVTKINQKALQCEDIVYTLTSKLNSSALSEIVNHLLKKENEKDAMQFDFLIDNVYVRDTLAEHLTNHSISSEKLIEIEYVEKTIEPSAKYHNQHPDWVSCVDAIKHNLFVTGCYDGIIRVWKSKDDTNDSKNPTAKLFAQHRGHIAPIKGIVSLYKSSEKHFFASVSKDRSVKVFGLNERTKQFKEISKVDTKNKNFSHRLTVECISAPYPSKVFATGSADKEIKIYRMLNNDTIANDKTENTEPEPPLKKRKLNDDDDDKADMQMSRLSNISTLRGHRNAIKCLDWNNPAALYSGSYDNCIKLWDIEKEIDSYTWTTQSALTCLKYWEAQNVLISAHTNLKIAIWDPRTDRKLQTKTLSESTFRSHRLPITGLDVDGGMSGTNTEDSLVRNSDYLFVSCSHDGKLKIWDIRSQTPLYTISKHSGKALCVGWYGNTIVSGGSDCKLHTFQWNKK